MGSPGDFGTVFINGYSLASDSTAINPTLAYANNKVQAQNVGIEQMAVGIQQCKLTLNGYRRSGQGIRSAHNLLMNGGVGNTNDLEFITTLNLGHQGSPTVGTPAILADLTRLNYNTDKVTPQGVQGFTLTADSRGKYWEMGNVLYDNTAAPTKGTVTSTPFDTGANAAGYGSYGAVCQTQLTTPTGTAATGSIGLTAGGGGQPSDGDKFTLTIGGITYIYTFKTNLTPVAGEVKIGVSAAATTNNLYSAMVGSIVGVGTNYATNTVSIPQYPIEQSLVIVGVPTAAANTTVPLTAVNTGVGANAYTLVATTNVSTHLAVSGATMTGGLAGDALTSLVYQSSTTSGGAYVVFATSALDGTKYTAERLEVAVGVTINRWVQIVLTMAASNSPIGLNCSFGRRWQL